MQVSPERPQNLLCPAPVISRPEPSRLSPHSARGVRSVPPGKAAREPACPTPRLQRPGIPAARALLAPPPEAPLRPPLGGRKDLRAYKREAQRVHQGLENSDPSGARPTAGSRAPPPARRTSGQPGDGVSTPAGNRNPCALEGSPKGVGTELGSWDRWAHLRTPIQAGRAPALAAAHWLSDSWKATPPPPLETFSQLQSTAY